VAGELERPAVFVLRALDGGGQAGLDVLRIGHALEQVG
jgi:hypothetical protein